MEITVMPARLKKFEIPGRVQFANGNGGLPKINLHTGRSTAEIYLHGAQVTGFQKNGGPPLLFLSRLSQFAAGQPIRGGVPICFPWFGPRPGDPAHGFARITEWELVESALTPDGGVQVRLQLPKIKAAESWPPFNAEFVVTVGDRLGMELVVANQSPDRDFEFENCLHTYFAVSDIGEISLSGLQGAAYLDKADNGARKLETADTVRNTAETNRVYPEAAGTLEIHDQKFRRIVRAEKSGSMSTVVWNPWTTQRMPDFDPAEHRQMLCVEAGNVGQNKLSLPPGKIVILKVVLSSQPL